MNLKNETLHPALAYKGVDQLGQGFHVVVMRQTYNWNDKGLLLLADEQDPLRFVDQLIDAQDLMSGIAEESDLAHYKPKCDVIIKGHAYTPLYIKNNTEFTANLVLKTPAKKVTQNTVEHKKYLFSDEPHTDKDNDEYTVGRTLINKALTILSPRHLMNDNFTGSTHYKLKIQSLPSRISLNPSSSFGGYCLLEDSNPAINKMNYDDLIPKKDRGNTKLNPHHGTIAYMEEDNYNPYGTGYSHATYLKYVKPSHIALSQIHHPDLVINESLLYKVASNNLDAKTHSKLVTGFGTRAKSHPARSKMIGTVDETFNNIQNVIPKGFNFAMWNSAYPDQQTDFLQGDEQITLTNLCSTKTLGASITDAGDTTLKLYLPDTLVYLAIESEQPNVTNTELPMRLDTVIVSPDEQKVNLVWRATIIDNYQPKSAMLSILNKQQKEALIQNNHYETADSLRLS